MKFKVSIFNSEAKPEDKPIGFFAYSFIQAKNEALERMKNMPAGTYARIYEQRSVLVYTVSKPD
jgi:hypothetical protein